MSESSQSESPPDTAPPYLAILKKYEEFNPSHVRLSADETAILTGLSPKTLESQRSRADGIPFIKLGRRVQYRLSDVMAYMDRRVFTNTRAAKTQRGAVQ